MRNPLRAVAVGALALLLGCGNESDLVAPAVGADVVKITIVNDSAPADGATLTAVSAQLDNRSSLARGRRTVSFSTTAGIFTTSGTASANGVTDSTGRALVLLRAPEGATVAIVRASGDLSSVYDTIVFVRALPTFIAVEPAKFRLHGTEEIIVTVGLRRSIGKVTTGTPVSFTARRAGGGSIGRFGIATLSDDNEKVTVRFTPADSTYRGAVIIGATVDGTQSVSGENTVDVVSPP